MSEFYYRGRIPASKSVLNRLLVLKSFSPLVEIEGDSKADDVLKMKAALSQLARGELADCGAAGTTLRFLSFRASRMTGTHNLSGSLRLFDRPQAEIGSILSQLGVEVSFGPQRLTLRGQGWQIPNTGVRIERSVSSQFASGLILSAWDLPRPLRLNLTGEAISRGYLQMTLDAVRFAGMEWRWIDDETLEIPAGAAIVQKKFTAESDLSSAFAVAGLAAIGGRAVFEGWPRESSQPDRAFTDILSRMGCAVEVNNDDLEVTRPDGNLRPIEVSLGDSPDLFPVLAVLCAFADGRSRLSGAPHLIYKESDRVAKSAELVRKLGRKVTAINDGLEIHGLVNRKGFAPFTYDSDHDHRLAMAAAIARLAGAPVILLRPEVVNKSFPEFWSIAGVQS